MYKGEAVIHAKGWHGRSGSSFVHQFESIVVYVEGTNMGYDMFNFVYYIAFVM